MHKGCSLVSAAQRFPCEDVVTIMFTQEVVVSDHTVKQLSVSMKNVHRWQTSATHDYFSLC